MRFPDDVPTLTDGVVTLRAPAPEDVPRIVEQCNDPASVAWTSVPAPYGHEDAVEWTGTSIPKAWDDDSEMTFAIEHDGRFVGSQSLRERGRGEAEVGFGLHPDARGRGVMRRALSLLLDWAFAERGYVVVQWRANVGNWPSRRTAWALGFTFGPTVPGLVEQRGERRDAWTGWIGAHDPRRPTTRWLEPPVLETDRLRLRPWRADDGARLVEAAHDSTLRHFIPASPLPRDLAAVPAYLDRIQEAAADGHRVAWCVADRRTDRALGNVAVFDLEGPGDGTSAQVGYWAHPDARGRGVTVEALSRVSDWTFAAAPDGLALDRVFLLTAVSNVGSRLVAERAGFVHVGTERSSARVGDGVEDNALFDRLSTD